MMLHFTIYDAPSLKQAIQAVPISESTHVMLIWCPDYFAVQSVLQHRLPGGENPTTLLKLGPKSFFLYHSTDDFFNAVIEVADLERFAQAVETLDTVAFSHSLEQSNGANDLGFLNARFNRPLVSSFREEFTEKDNTISMKIIGMFPESFVKSIDVSFDPSFCPLPPVATIRAPVFGQVMSSLEKKGMTVVIRVQKNEVFFSAQGGGEATNPMTVKAETGLMSTRADVWENPVKLEFPLANLELEPGSRMSEEVSLYKRSEEVKLICFKLNSLLTFLHGDLIYYFY